MTDAILNGLLQKIKSRPSGRPFRTCGDPVITDRRHDAGYALGIHNCCLELWRRGVAIGQEVRPGQWDWEAVDDEEAS